MPLFPRVKNKVNSFSFIELCGLNEYKKDLCVCVCVCLIHNTSNTKYVAFFHQAIF